MTLLLTEEQQMLQTAARDFLAERAPVAALRALRDAGNERGFDDQLWQAMVEMGWPGVVVEEAYGGLDFGFMGAGVLFEEIGRQLAVAPLLSSAVLGATALRLGADESLKQALLPKVVAGDLLLALAVEEGPRHGAHTATSAVSDPGADTLTLSGAKRMVIDGTRAHQLIVSAQAPDGAAALFLVAADAPGITLESQLLVDSHRVAEMHFSNVPVLARLGAYDAGGAPLLDHVLDAGRVCMAAELLGLADEAFTRTLDYLRTRKQFGVVIGQFQSLQHRAAHLFCELELARSTLRRALHALDQNEADRGRWVSLAKNKCGRVGRLATQEAIQMHGGIGMTDEFDIGFFLKRARALEMQLGDTDAHAQRYAAALGF